MFKKTIVCQYENYSEKKESNIDQLANLLLERAMYSFSVLTRVCDERAFWRS